MITDVQGKKVLCRVDFNVPLDKDYNISDSTRIDRTLPTIKSLMANGASVILMSHFGRPLKKLKQDGTIDFEKYSLKHLISYLEEKLSTPILFAESCIGDQAIQLSKDLQPGQILLLENTRFHKEEKNGDIEFAAKLAKHGDLFVNDAFGAAHRAHASTSKVASFFKPEEKSFGLLMEAEIQNAKKVMKNPGRPCVAIFGGAKVSDKLKLIEQFMDFADTIVIGGGMSYTFFKAMGGEIGNSLFEEDYVGLASDLIDRAKDYGVTLLLPEDSIAADDFSNGANIKEVQSNEIPNGWMGLDVGPKSIKAIQSVIAEARTIIWNGPLGVFEMDNFSTGTMSIANAIANKSVANTFSLVGGGDSVAAINKAGVQDKISFISTGGGALLEFLEGKKLPGIVAIESA